LLAQTCTDKSVLLTALYCGIRWHVLTSIYLLILTIPRYNFIRSMHFLKKLIGSYFEKEILLYTPLLKWYLQQGLIFFKFHCAIKYTPEKSVQQFADEVSDAWYLTGPGRLTAGSRIKLSTPTDLAEYVTVTETTLDNSWSHCPHGGPRSSPRHEGASPPLC
jgi:hypothetical protein